jgi:hypothetical protein
LLGVAQTNGYTDPAWAPESSLGFCLCTNDVILNNGGDLLAPTGSITASTQWINDNAAAILVNRYNGTLIRGE